MTPSPSALKLAENMLETWDIGKQRMCASGNEFYSATVEELAALIDEHNRELVEALRDLIENCNDTAGNAFLNWRLKLKIHVEHAAKSLASHQPGKE